MKTRSIKELLIVLLKQGRKIFVKKECCGLCGLVGVLDNHDIINSDEKIKLRAYINKECNGLKEYWCSDGQVSPFYFPMNKWAPRERWLKEQINKL